MCRWLISVGGLSEKNYPRNDCIWCFPRSRFVSKNKLMSRKLHVEKKKKKKDLHLKLKWLRHWLLFVFSRVAIFPPSALHICVARWKDSLNQVSCVNPRLSDCAWRLRKTSSLCSPLRLWYVCASCVCVATDEEEVKRRRATWSHRLRWHHIMSCSCLRGGSQFRKNQFGDILFWILPAPYSAVLLFRVYSSLDSLARRFHWLCSCLRLLTSWSWTTISLSHPSTSGWDLGWPAVHSSTPLWPEWRRDSQARSGACLRPTDLHFRSWHQNLKRLQQNQKIQSNLKILRSRILSLVA